jgi:Zn-dependent protease with chaperone function
MDESKRYELVKHIVGVSKFVLDVLILIFLLTSGWSARIRTFAETAVNAEWQIVIIYMFIVGAVLKLVELPVGFYSGYLLEHRFGLSRQTVGGWIKDQLKGFAIAVPLSLAAIEFIYFLLRVHPNEWWLYAGVAFSVFIVAMANLAPVLLLPLFFKFKPVENADLHYRVDRLARRTGTNVCGIFEWSLGEKTRKANAAVVGWGNTRRIIVSDTLLENFSGEEIEVIMAHELCHHVKNHIWYGMGFQSIVTLVAFYAAHRILLPLSRSFSLNGISDIAGFPLLALVMTVLSLAVLPIVNYFSRRLETAADVYALDVTGDALAFVSSMEKLADINLANKSPNKLIEFIFYSHPSVEERINLAADRVGQNV